MKKTEKKTKKGSILDEVLNKPIPPTLELDLFNAFHKIEPLTSAGKFLLTNSPQDFKFHIVEWDRSDVGNTEFSICQKPDIETCITNIKPFVPTFYKSDFYNALVLLVNKLNKTNYPLLPDDYNYQSQVVWINKGRDKDFFNVNEVKYSLVAQPEHDFAKQFSNHQVNWMLLKTEALQNLANPVITFNQIDEKTSMLDFIKKHKLDIYGLPGTISQIIVDKINDTKHQKGNYYGDYSFEKFEKDFKNLVKDLKQYDQNFLLSSNERNQLTTTLKKKYRLVNLGRDSLMLKPFLINEVELLKHALDPKIELEAFNKKYSQKVRKSR